MHKVVVGALVSGDQVLLAHRSPNKRAYPGFWDLPGGGVEAGETELEALVRELREELGVMIAPSSVSHLGRVEVGPATDPAQLSATDEHDEIGWFDIDDLPTLAHAPVRTALVNAMRGPEAGCDGPGPGSGGQHHRAW